MVTPWHAHGLMRLDKIVCPLARKLRLYTDLQECFSLPRTSLLWIPTDWHLATSITGGDLVFDPSFHWFEGPINVDPTEGCNFPDLQDLHLTSGFLDERFLKHTYMAKWERVLGRELSCLFVKLSRPTLTKALSALNKRKMPIKY